MEERRGGGEEKGIVEERRGEGNSGGAQNREEDRRAESRGTGRYILNHISFLHSFLHYLKLRQTEFLPSLQ